MNEEAGFIGALLAELEDRTTLLVYADWLDEHADPRAEYVRFLATAQPNQRRLAERLIVELRLVVDPIWDFTLTHRIGRGSPVRIIEGAPYAGAFAGHTGEVIDLRLRTAADDTLGGDNVIVVVRITIWGRPLDLVLDCSTVERIAAPAS